MPAAHAVHTVPLMKFPAPHTLPDPPNIEPMPADRALTREDVRDPALLPHSTEGVLKADRSE